MDTNSIYPRKKFGDPGYRIPEVEYLDTPAPQEIEEEKYGSDVIPVPEQPITEAMRASLMGAPDPIEENSRIALEGIKSGPDSVPIPESLKPRSLKQNLKDALLGMIPIYGPARTYTQESQQQYDLGLYKQQVAQEQAEYNVRKEAAMSWHDAKIKQDQEVSTRQSKIKLLLSVYPNAAPQQVMKAAGIQIPTGKQVKFETRKVRVFGSDGATPSDWVASEYNPVTSMYTYRDPETRQMVTAPIDLIADVQKVGVPSAAPSNPLQQKADTMKGLLGRDLSEQELMRMGGIDEESATGSVEKELLNLATKEKLGTITADEKARLSAGKELKLMVPGFTAANAADRAEDRTARNEVAKALLNLTDGRRRYNTMLSAAKGPGWNDMILLSNHIAMTFGDVKGARTGTQLIEAHLNARSLPDKLAVMARGVINGDRLSDAQRKGFLAAARDRVMELQESYDQQKTAWNYAPPGESGMLQKYPFISNDRVLVTGRDGKGQNTLPADQVDRYLKKYPKAKRIAK
jgi:hypothetical protein